MKVALFIPCYVDQAAPGVGKSTVALLRRLGCDVVYPAEQTCCGQPAFNTGFWNEARELAERETKLFSKVDADVIVCPSGSCAAMQKVFYPTLLEGTDLAQAARDLSERTWELTQFLVHCLKRVDVGATFNGRAALHPSCHSLRELNARTEARTLLSYVKGLELVPLVDDEECCGFGGTFSVKVADISSAMGEVKTDNIKASGAEWVISGDSSCLMHLSGVMAKRSMGVKTIHLAEVLASTA
jgi:L-lactate dehydrogenase complex protein LldE